MFTRRVWAVREREIISPFICVNFKFFFETIPHHHLQPTPHPKPTAPERANLSGSLLLLALLPTRRMEEVAVGAAEHVCVRVCRYVRKKKQT